jgi:uncharacterized integral membrane protein (TIGR00697 family)
MTHATPVVPDAPPTIAKLYGALWRPQYMHYPACVLAMIMLVNQTLALKVVDFWGFSAVASTVTYPISLVVCDILTEVYGFRRTRQLIYTCLVMYVVCMLLTQFVAALPPAPEYQLNPAYLSLFSQLPQIAVAGVMGYLAGELINAWIMSHLKRRTDGELFFYRALLSTLVSQTINCLIFFGVGFWGTMGWETVVTSSVISVIIILGYEIFCLPLTHRISLFLKRLEGVDYFDLPSRR